MAAILVCIGCSAQPDPTPDAPPSLSGAGPLATPEQPTTQPTPTAPPSSPPPVAPALANLPQTARHRTAKGAEAFVAYYMALTNDVSTNPRSGVLRPLEASTCKSCQAFEANTRALIRDHERYAGPPLLIEGVAGLSGNPGKDPNYRVGTVVRQSGHPIVNAAGATVQRIPVRHDTFIVYLEWHDPSWKVVEIKVLQEERS